MDFFTKFLHAMHILEVTEIHILISRYNHIIASHNIKIRKKYQFGLRCLFLEFVGNTIELTFPNN